MKLEDFVIGFIIGMVYVGFAYSLRLFILETDSIISTIWLIVSMILFQILIIVIVVDLKHDENI